MKKSVEFVKEAPNDTKIVNRNAASKTKCKLKWQSLADTTNKHRDKNSNRDIDINAKGGNPSNVASRSSLMSNEKMDININAKRGNTTNVAPRNSDLMLNEKMKYQYRWVEDALSYVPFPNMSLETIRSMGDDAVRETLEAFSQLIFTSREGNRTERGDNQQEDVKDRDNALSSHRTRLEELQNMSHDDIVALAESMFLFEETRESSVGEVVPTLPIATMVEITNDQQNTSPLNEINIPDNIDVDDRSAYTGHLVDEFFIQKEKTVFACIPFLTYKRLVIICFVSMIGLAGVFIKLASTPNPVLLVIVSYPSVAPSNVPTMTPIPTFYPTFSFGVDPPGD